MPYKNPPILNETDDPKLRYIHELLTGLFEENGAYIEVTPVGATAADGLNISVTLHASDGMTAAQHAAKVRSKIPAAYKPSVEATTVFFTLPFKVAGIHGRVGTYTTHKCHDAICQAFWRVHTVRIRVARKAKIDAAPRVTLANGDVVSYVTDGNGKEHTVVHGDKWARQNWMCDCDLCKGTHAKYENKRRTGHRAKAAAAKAVPTTTKTTTKAPAKKAAPRKAAAKAPVKKVAAKKAVAKKTVAKKSPVAAKG